MTDVLSLDASSNAFLASRPEWTLAGTLLPLAAGDVVLDQEPFRCLAGVWEAEVSIRPAAHADSVPKLLTLRIDSETIRRWKDIGINPYLEACAQVREHLGRGRGEPIPALTLL